jgi:hypothetical protein
MTDDSSNDRTRRPNPDRRPSPFDDGFVTLWQQGAATPPTSPTGPSDDPTKTDDLLPDAWRDDGDGLPIADRPSDPGEEPVDIAIDALRGEDAVAERSAAQAALRPVLRSLEAVGLYAYITLDDENRWSVASDDEQGRVDVRLDDGEYEVVMAATSPGMYADEDNGYRRKSLERLARMLIPRVARGYLADHQKASWDDVEAGISVQVRYVLPRAAPEAVGPFVREHFEELEELLAFVDEQISR